MNKSGIFTIFTLYAAIFCACYALGIFGGENVRNVQGKVYAGDAFSYTGALLDGKFDGKGSISLSDGSSYSGFFKDCRFNGDGVFIASDGWSFEGKFKDGEPDEGVFRYEGGELTYSANATGEEKLKARDWTYSGKFGDFGQNGNGAFEFSDGSSYIGDFKMGLADGTGTYTDKDGAIVYEGDFSAGLFAGQGTYCSPEGWSYKGGFENGLFNGSGVINDNGEKITGVWKAGVKIE